MSQFGNRIRELREHNHLLQREIAAKLGIDAPLYSKIERGERTAKKEIVVLLANILKSDVWELLTLWLSDQVFDLIKEEKVAIKVLESVSGRLNQ